MYVIIKGEKNIEFRKKLNISIGDVVYLVCEKKVHGHIKVEKFDYWPLIWIIHPKMEQFTFDGNVYERKNGISNDKLLNYAGYETCYLIMLYITNFNRYPVPISIEDFGIKRSPRNYCHVKNIPRIILKADNSH
jgi:predicted transcriptional regulator